MHFGYCQNDDYSTLPKYYVLKFMYYAKVDLVLK